jgi:sucrose-6-phosphatase
MDPRILLFTDMDRTIIPNGAEEESPEARPLFRSLAMHPSIVLVYASGRSRPLIEEAIEEYDLPIPDYAIGDVGTTVYETGKEWSPVDEWEKIIAEDWHGKSHGDIVQLLHCLEELQLQESYQQNKFKVSYYTPSGMDSDALVSKINSLLEQANINASIVWSVDEAKDIGLVDVLPRRATKNEACHFLIEKLDFSQANSVYAGDSGNDLAPLTSGMQAVLVKNARDEVKTRAREMTVEKDIRPRLYIAKGGLFGMNGNYAAGVLEGLIHHIPRAGDFISTSNLS